MNTLHGLAETLRSSTRSRVTPLREQAPSRINSVTGSLQENQIEALVRQLFFRADSVPRRHIGFTPAEASLETGTLCLEVARVLARECKYDIGVIDAFPDAAPLHEKLRLAPTKDAGAAWLLSPRLWMVPRQSWIKDEREEGIGEEDLGRLGEIMAEFDFSILRCAPVSWRTTPIGDACDGLVLVLSANKTRRLVAAQIAAQIRKSEAPLLGTVLAERTFPVPQALYRSL